MTEILGKIGMFVSSALLCGIFIIIGTKLGDKTGTWVYKKLHKTPPAKSSWRYEIRFVVTKYNGERFIGTANTECNHPIGAYDKVVEDIAKDIYSRNEAKGIALFSIKEVV